MAYKKKEQPGFVIPFFMIDALESMPAALAGRFVIAMGRYSERGTEPVFNDAESKMLWFTAKSWLDNNKSNYEDSCLSHKYNRWCGVLKEKGREYEIVSFDDYKLLQEMYLDYQNDCESLPCRPLPFDNWRSKLTDRALQEGDGVLPFDL